MSSKENAVTLSFKHRILSINSPEKLRCIKSIGRNDDENIGCELVNFKKFESGDVLVNFTSVKIELRKAIFDCQLFHCKGNCK